MELQILSDKVEEKLLQQSVKKGLWVDGHYNNYYNHCTTMSGFTSDLKGNLLEYSNSPDYIKIDIIIDNQIINLYTHKDIKRGYLHYFHYNSENLFENGGKFKYDLYLAADDVLDNKPFFTTNPLERRRLKVLKLKERISTK